MTRRAARRGAFVAVGTLAQLVLRPDLAGPQWAEGSALELWLALEAGAAVAIGALAPDRTLVIRAVVLGWFLQAFHFGALGEHYDDTLWGVGLVGQAVLGAAALGLALLVHRLTGQARR